MPSICVISLRSESIIAVTLVSIAIPAMPVVRDDESWVVAAVAPPRAPAPLSAFSFASRD
jgi:hypothetical protein